MKTKQEILKKYWDSFSKAGLPMSDNAVECFTEAMEEYGKREYDRGVEDGKIIAEHGTVNWIE